MNSCKIALTVVLFCTCLVFFTSARLEVCNEPVDEGIRGDKIGIRLYYDKTTDRCKPFAYNGAGGNGNRFFTDRQCMKRCSTLGEQIYPDDDRVCLLEKDLGHCKGTYLLWYFDHVLKKCRPFIYGGCAGNGNRFVNETTCCRKCAQAPACEQTGKEDEGPDVGLVLGITVGCTAAVILVSALAIFIQKIVKKYSTREKKQNKPLANMEMY
ncbi:kunitz-type serine protease inhibitor bitisilin-3-like [Trachemys scripta elegans]|uniref:kunitz-type serine protease inhibitor bitisilin-3-like n=1 Tax=Trachemys scripta elegans TaxID=31138 RepID=UPI001555AFFB|nr:kunitz-type serine protease inhibitor bitisilin-3-like [Trachemys scripta elegans]